MRGAKLIGASLGPEMLLFTVNGTGAALLPPAKTLLTARNGLLFPALANRSQWAPPENVGIRVRAANCGGRNVPP